MALTQLPYNPQIAETNAAFNRRMAIKCAKAGKTVAEIAAHWPKIWKVEQYEGKDCLSQIYDSIYKDGRKETKYSMVGVPQFLGRKKRK
jgi:hypothetical protein